MIEIKNNKFIEGIYEDDSDIHQGDIAAFIRTDNTIIVNKIIREKRNNIWVSFQYDLCNNHTKYDSEETFMFIPESYYSSSKKENHQKRYVKLSEYAWEQIESAFNSLQNDMNSVTKKIEDDYTKMTSNSFYHDNEEKQQPLDYIIKKIESADELKSGMTIVSQTRTSNNSVCYELNHLRHLSNSKWFDKDVFKTRAFSLSDNRIDWIADGGFSSTIIGAEYEDDSCFVLQDDGSFNKKKLKLVHYQIKPEIFSEMLMKFGKHTLDNIRDEIIAGYEMFNKGYSVIKLDEFKLDENIAYYNDFCESFVHNGKEWILYDNAGNEMGVYDSDVDDFLECLLSCDVSQIEHITQKEVNVDYLKEMGWESHENKENVKRRLILMNC